MYRLYVIFVSDRLRDFDASRDLLIRSQERVLHRFLTWRSYDQITPRGYLWSTARFVRNRWEIAPFGKQDLAFDGVTDWLDSQCERPGSLGVWHRSAYDKIIGEGAESWPHLRQHIAKMQQFMDEELGKPHWEARVEPLVEDQILIEAAHIVQNKFLQDLAAIRSARPINHLGQAA